MPFYLGGATFVLAIAVLATGHRLLGAAEAGLVAGEPVAPRLEPVGPAATAVDRPVVVAVGATAGAGGIVDAAAAVARDLGAPLEVVRVRETTVIEELAIDPEDAESARASVTAHLDRLAAHGIAATGQVLISVGDHASAGRALARHADEVRARIVAVGRSPRGPLAQFADGSFTAALTHAAAGTVMLVEPQRPPYELTTQSLNDLRTRSA